MNQEENERKYASSISDIAVLRGQVEKLASAVGDMKLKLDDMPDMESKIEKLTSDVAKMQIGVTRVLSALTGDELNPEGLISKVQKSKDDIGDFKKEMRLQVEDVSRQVKEVVQQLNKKDINVKLVIAFVVFIATLIGKTIWEYWFNRKAQ